MVAVKVGEAKAMLADRTRTICRLQGCTCEPTIVIHGDVRNPTSPTNPLLIEAAHKDGCPLDPGRGNVSRGGLHFVRAGGRA